MNNSGLTYRTKNREPRRQETIGGLQERVFDALLSSDQSVLQYDPNMATCTPLADQTRSASRLLANYPNMVTHSILCAALRLRPPLKVVRSLLVLNPRAAECPTPRGPTALFVAVQSNCPLPVVKCVMEAWPEALDHKHVQVDPVELAQQFRPREAELLHMLVIRQQQLRVSATSAGDLVSEASSTNAVLLDDRSERTLMGATSSFCLPPPPPPPPRQLEEPSTPCTRNKKSSPVSSPHQNERTLPPVRIEGSVGLLGAAPLPTTSQRHDQPWIKPWRQRCADKAEKSSHRSNSPTQTSCSDCQDLSNVKLICASVLKGHRKLLANVEALLEDSATKNQAMDQLGAELAQHKTQVSRQMAREAQQLLATQLMALDDMFAQREAALLKRLNKGLSRQKRLGTKGIDGVQKRLDMMETQMITIREPLPLTQGDQLGEQQEIVPRYSPLTCLKKASIVYVNPPSTVLLDQEDTRSLLTEGSSTLARKNCITGNYSKSPLWTQWRLLLCQPSH